MRTRKGWVWGLVGLLALAAPAVAADVENPGYKMWAKYKPGTMVKQKMVTKGGPAESEMEMTQTLKEVKPEKAVVSVATSMVAMGTKMDMPAQNQDIPAKISDTDAAAADPSKKPDAKVTTGEETIKVAGKDIKCKWTEITFKQDDTTIVSKSWTSDEIPGTNAKSQTSFKGGPMDGAVTTMEVTAFEVK
jgi:hypothetical protein